MGHDGGLRPLMCVGSGGRAIASSGPAVRSKGVSGGTTPADQEGATGWGGIGRTCGVVVGVCEVLAVQMH